MKRKILPMLLASCAVLCGLAFAAEPEPEARIVGVSVAADKTIEVGIAVGGEGQPLFGGVGVVLEYDKTVLTPANWETGGAAADTTDTPPGWEPVDVYAPAWVNDAAAQVYTGSAGSENKGYLALQAGTEFPYTLPQTRRVVTVKFAYEGETAPQTRAECGLALCGDKDITLSSRIQHVGFYAAASDAFYYHTPLRAGADGTAEDDSALAASQKLNLLFTEEIPEGPSQQPAGGGLENAVPVTFYDWDAKTYLGGIVVDRNQDNAQAAQAFAAQLIGEGDGETYPLSAKTNYRFGKWIPMDSDAPTSYGTAVDVSNVGRIVTIPEPEGADFSKVPEKGLVVKAAYIADTDALSALDSVDKRTYGIKLLYGDRINAQTYALTFQIERNGVHRLRDLALRVEQRTETGNAQALVFCEVEDLDQAIAQVVVTTAMKNITVNVVDNSLATWSTAPQRGASEPITREGENGFVVLGYVGATNELLVADNKAGITAAYFTNMKITLTTDNVYGATAATKPAALRSLAQENLQKAWKERNGIPEESDEWDKEQQYIRLSRAEMIAAIAAGHYVKVEE